MAKDSTSMQRAEQAKLLVRSQRPKISFFLGFTHYAATSKTGYYMPGHKTSKEGLRRKVRDMNEWLKRVRSVAPFKEWRSVLHAKLVGHYNYFGISNNMRCIRQFYG